MARERHMNEKRTVGYFSMEIGLEVGIPTYSGGLGVLAGDTIRSAADLGVPMVAVTLLHRKGYFYQKLDHTGWQQEEPVQWVVEDFLQEMTSRVTVVVEGREVQVRCWRYEVQGITGHGVPVYYLDTDLPENAEPDRALTHYLYGGDKRYRLCQEVVLGFGGVRMLRALPTPVQLPMLPAAAPTVGNSATGAAAGSADPNDATASTTQPSASSGPDMQEHDP